MCNRFLVTKKWEIKIKAVQTVFYSSENKLGLLF